MKKGIFLCSSDRRTAYMFEKKIQEELNLKIKETVTDLGMVDKEAETVLYIDKGDIPSDYELKGQNILVLTEGMDFSRWKKFISRGINVIKLDDELIYLKQELMNLGYRIGESLKRVEDTELKPYLAGEKLTSKDGIIGMYSIKDGIGKTTMALNLAGFIKEVSPQTRVLLLDLDNNFSSLKRFVENNSGVTEIESESSSVLERLDKKVFKYNKSEFYIIPCEEKAIKPDDIVAMLEESRKHFDLIIIDINSQIDEKLITTLSCVSMLFLITDNRYQIKNDTAKFAKTTLLDLGVKAPEPYVIINKEPDQYAAGYFEDEFGLKVAGLANWDSEIPEYEEKKLIYSLGNKKSNLANCIQNVIKLLGLETDKKIKTKFQNIFQ